MDYSALQDFVGDAWFSQAMPALSSCMVIPCESPAFDPEWQAKGYMDQAIELMTEWSRSRLASIPGVTIEVVRLGSRTPAIFIRPVSDDVAELTLNRAWRPNWP